MNGAIMMLKSLGFDPDQIIGMVKNITASAEAVDHKLTANAAEIAELRADVKRVMELLEKLTNSTNGE